MTIRKLLFGDGEITRRLALHLWYCRLELFYLGTSSPSATRKEPEL
jgi:hypothetical protein